MAFEISGKVIDILPVNQVSDKFRKREFVIERKETGGTALFIDYIKFQLLQENLIMMDSSRMDEKALEEMFHVIEKKKVKCLVGYSSALGELSEYIRKTGRDCSRCVYLSKLNYLSPSPAEEEGAERAERGAGLAESAAVEPELVAEGGLEVFGDVPF